MLSPAEIMKGNRGAYAAWLVIHTNKVFVRGKISALATTFITSGSFLTGLSTFLINPFNPEQCFDVYLIFLLMYQQINSPFNTLMAKTLINVFT